MSELDNFAEIPIFPLPLVLLPYEVLPLHIFEPRYRKMLRDVRESDSRFGIVFFENDEDLDRPEIDSIGCVARVTQNHLLADGRSNIETLGEKRFFIREYPESNEPYLVARVQYFHDDLEPEADFQTFFEMTVKLFDDIAQNALKNIPGKEYKSNLPTDDAEITSFLMSVGLNLPNVVKLDLLETRSTHKRLEIIHNILEKFNAQIKDAQFVAKVSKTNGHAKKKLDI